jgi:hypothetical protein
MYDLLYYASCNGSFAHCSLLLETVANKDDGQEKWPLRVLGARMTPSPERGFLRTVTDFVASQEMDPQYRTVLPAG